MHSARRTTASFEGGAWTLALVQSVEILTSESAGGNVVQQLLIAGTGVFAALICGAFPASIGAGASVATALHRLTSAVILAGEWIETGALGLLDTCVGEFIVDGASWTIAASHASSGSQALVFALVLRQRLTGAAAWIRAFRILPAVLALTNDGSCKK